MNADRTYNISRQKTGMIDIFNIDLEKKAKIFLEPEDVEPNITEN